MSVEEQGVEPLAQDTEVRIHTLLCFSCVDIGLGRDYFSDFVCFLANGFFFSFPPPPFRSQMLFPVTMVMRVPASLNEPTLPFFPLFFARSGAGSRP